MGASVVNALSTWLEVTVHKNGKIYRMRFERGIPQTGLEVIGETDKNGTSVTFLPDPTIFDTVTFEENREFQRMKQEAYLTPGVTFTIISRKTGEKARYYYEGGIQTWLHNIVGHQERLGSFHYFKAEGKDCLAEIAFQFVATSNVLGFKSALLKIINEIAAEKDKIDKKI